MVMKLNLNRDSEEVLVNILNIETEVQSLNTELKVTTFGTYV